MDLHPDLTDLLAAFESCGVEYVVVGGWAVASHGRPRYTKDLDLWIGPEDENLSRFVKALALFGAPASIIEQASTLKVEEFLFLGRPPARIDILRSIPGVEFRDAWSRRMRIEWNGLPVDVIALDDLIATKEAAGRAQDLADVEELRRLAKSAPRDPGSVRKRPKSD